MEYPDDFPDVWHLRMTEYSINRIDYLVSMGAELEARDFRDVYDSLEYLYRAFVVEERVKN